LGVTLIHAKPYDAPARGKMERFWRTLREGCLDHLGTMTSLHDVQARLLAFLDEHYHKTPHGGLLGKTPVEVWAGARTRIVKEAELSTALTISARRRVRKDGTVDIAGVPWQLDQSFLSGCVVTIAVDLTGAAERSSSTTAIATCFVSSMRSPPASCAANDRHLRRTTPRMPSPSIRPVPCSIVSSAGHRVTVHPRRTDHVRAVPRALRAQRATVLEGDS
jgi:putative transposase